MNNKSITILPPTALNFDDLCEWVQKGAVTSATKCKEAKEYFEQLETYHRDIAELMRELTQLKEENSEHAFEEAKNIAAVVFEILEAMNSLREDQDFASEEATGLEEMEKNIQSSEDGKKAAELISEDGQKFLTKYNYHKARLGLNTQEEVSKLTGIDRRYISILESGKHQPQFKTIKKIADGFGIVMTDLID